MFLGLRKLGNICFGHKCFPVCPRATFVADTNFVSGTQKMFPIFFRNILCPQQMFPSFAQPKKHHGQQCVLVYQGLYEFLTSQTVETIQKNWCARVHYFNFKWQFNPSDLFKAQSIIRRREIVQGKPLFQVDFSKNSTTTNRLFALDLCEVIADEAFLINYHLIEIESE